MPGTAHVLKGEPTISNYGSQGKSQALYCNNQGATPNSSNNQGATPNSSTPNSYQGATPNSYKFLIKVRPQIPPCLKEIQIRKLSAPMFPSQPYNSDQSCGKEPDCAGNRYRSNTEIANTSCKSCYPSKFKTFWNKLPPVSSK